MKTGLTLVVALLAMTACENPSEPTAPTAPAGYDRAAYQPFPQGFGYLQMHDSIMAAIDSADTALIRRHAWSLWAGISQTAVDTNWPVWFTWPNTYDVFINPPASGQMGAKASVPSDASSHASLIKANRMHGTQGWDTNNVFTPNAPIYPIPASVQSAYSSVIVKGAINIGRHFMSNGDIMIPTESFSIEGYDWVTSNNLNKQATLTALHEKGEKSLEAPEQYIVTKHMYWPIVASQPCIFPIWNPSQFEITDPNYTGYETWQSFAAIDLTGANPVGSNYSGQYLHNVFTDSSMKTPWGPITGNGTVADISSFDHHLVSKADWAKLDSADQASIMAACYWAYNVPFTPGKDYLITVAMHINTKEVDSWALQSVWWTPTPGTGRYGANQPNLTQAQGPWKNYDMVAEYGLIDSATGKLPVAFNPYIEPVIHPLATNCRNCHQRAGWPAGKVAGTASYQNPDCKDLLDPLTPASACLQDYLLTDMQWVISDHAAK